MCISSAMRTATRVIPETADEECSDWVDRELIALGTSLDVVKRLCDRDKSVAIIVRTCAVDPDELCRRMRAYGDAGADAVVVENAALLKAALQRGAFSCPVIVEYDVGARLDAAQGACAVLAPGKFLSTALEALSPAVG